MVKVILKILNNKNQANILRASEQRKLAGYNIN